MTTMQLEWSSAKDLILGDDPQLRVSADVSLWIKKIELFRKGEDERMIDRDPAPEDLEVHKSLLQRLIADGEHLLSLIRQVGLPHRGDGVTLDAVAATLDLLQADFRGWHKPMAPERREQILKEAFPEIARTPGGKIRNQDSIELRKEKAVSRIRDSESRTRHHKNSVCLCRIAGDEARHASLDFERVRIPFSHEKV